jgi:hypothetical protein
MQISLRKGDIFFVRTDAFITNFIIFYQRLWTGYGDYNKDAFYGHVGVIIDSDGTIYESTSVIGEGNLSKYKGYSVCILRHNEMTNSLFVKGFSAVENYRGCTYPFWRYPLYLLGLADNIHLTFPVCSELAGIFLNKAGLLNNIGWGLSPKELLVLCEETKKFQVIYEGVF